ncbi:STAS domain-containing protein [Planosporangium sp. 12N6]|uniref:STAS domain-containing protein n=1 Tax=Planosporangium spinosum TaxID=3402278 RepID=UPI003CEA6FA2
MSTLAHVSTRRRPDGVVVVTARGEFDLRTTDLLRGALVDALTRQRPDRLIVDVAGVTFMDSMGLRALVGAYRLASRQNTRFGMADPSPFMRQKLEAVGLAGILGVPPTDSDADRAGQDVVATGTVATGTVATPA